MVRSIICASIILLAVNVAFSHSTTGTKVIYSYPMNGAHDVHPNTNIGFTFSQVLSSNLPQDSITIFSGNEKEYSGHLKLSVNRRTLIFTPSTHFQLGEIIHVRLGSFQTITGDITEPFTMSFSIREKLATPYPDFHSDDPITEQALHPNFSPMLEGHEILSDPYDTLPQIDILKDNDPQDGYMYIANYTWHSIQPLTYGIVLDKDGTVKNLMGNGADYYNDFKPHPDGTYTFFDAVKKLFFISDTGFRIIDSIIAPSGYETDGHELRVSSDNNYWFIAIDYVITDMSKVVQGGHNPAVLVTPIILEYDGEKNLIFEWRSLDHFTVTDATYEDMLSAQIDFCHVNSIAFDGDSNLLISCRHMDEVTKIDKETGNIIWRWGGKHNEFRLVGDTMMFSHQHAVRRTNEGTYTMMDNGNFHDVVHPFSRALEFRLDQENKIATEIWQFRHTPDVFSGAMGYVQRIHNKSTLIGWGECDSLAITEVDSNNVVQFDLWMPGGTYSYRAFKYDSNYVLRHLESAPVASSASSGMNLVCSPNPMMNAATIVCTLAKAGYTDLRLVDILGREVSDIYSGYLSEGEHEFHLDAKHFPDGAYYINGRVGGVSVVQEKILIAK